MLSLIFLLHSSQVLQPLLVNSELKSCLHVSHFNLRILQSPRGSLITATLFLTIMVQLSIVILEEQKSKLMALAKQKMQSQASLVRQALQEFLKCQTSG